MANEIKNQIIKSVTAVICAGALCITANTCVAKISDTKIEAASKASNGVVTNEISGSDSTGSNEDATVEQNDISDVPDATETDKSTEETAENESADTSGNSTSDNKPSSSAGNKEKTTAEIVALYNNSVNRVKKEAKKITRDYKKLSSPEDQLELPSAVSAVGKWAIKTFVKGSDEPESWTDKSDMKIVFPVGNTDYSSKMTADMVKTATCKDNGSTYQIEIVLLNDKITSPVKGQGYAGVFNTVDGNSIKDANIPGVTFNKIDVNGINGSISCTIDKASGRITTATFRNTDKLYIDAKAVATVKVKLALVSEEKFTIAY